MVRQEIEMDQTDTPRIRKRLMSDQIPMPVESAGEIDIASHASLAYWSEDPNHPLQDYTFSPQGATFEHEDVQLDLPAISHMRLTVVPNKGGSGIATLTSLRLFA
jgi:hypothetical protein